MMALMGTVLAACQPMDEIVPQELIPRDGKWTIIVEATREIPGQAGNDGLSTKGLELQDNGSTLFAYWGATSTTNEYVWIGFNNGSVGSLDITPTSNKSTTATLSGHVNVDNTNQVNKGDLVALLYPRRDWDYTGQDGEAPSETATISKQYNYASAFATIVKLGYPRTISTSSATFINGQSVYRFRFKKDGTAFTDIKEFTLMSNKEKLVSYRTFQNNDWTSSYGSLTVKPKTTPQDGFYYMSIRNENDVTTESDLYSFTILDSNEKLYVGQQNIPGGKWGNGNFISAGNIAIRSNFSMTSGSVSEVW